MLKYFNIFRSKNPLKTFLYASTQKYRPNHLIFSPQVIGNKVLKSHSFNYHHSHRRCPNAILAVGFSLFGFLGSEDKKLNPEDEIIMMIKRSILSMKRKAYTHSEQLLHIALTMAQRQNNQLAITYIYDVMANLAMEREEYMKAEKLYVLVMQRLMAEGVHDDDLKMIHMSVKVAKIKFHLKQYDQAEQGFLWCIHKLNSQKGNPDALILLGVAHDYYAVFLLEKHRATEAIKSLKIAYDIMLHSQNVGEDFLARILNDLGTACYEAKLYNDAEIYLIKGIEISRDLPEQDFLPSLMANLGMVYISKGMMEEARRECKHAWDMARQKNDKSGLQQANYCLDEIDKIRKK